MATMEEVYKFRSQLSDIYSNINITNGDFIDNIMENLQNKYEEIKYDSFSHKLTIILKNKIDSKLFSEINNTILSIVRSFLINNLNIINQKPSEKEDLYNFISSNDNLYDIYFIDNLITATF